GSVPCRARAARGPRPAAARTEHQMSATSDDRRAAFVARNGTEHPQTVVLGTIRTGKRAAAARACLDALLAEVPPDRWPLGVCVGRALMRSPSWEAAWLKAATAQAVPVEV